MIKLSELGKNFLWTTRIDLDAENYIELREPNQTEIVNLSDDNNKNLAMFEKIFPACVIDSSIINDDGSKASGKAILEELKKSGSLCVEVLTRWIESIPFQHRLMSGEKSDK
ncbi:MAG: hypothetical protein MJZ03_03375 [archaeon]|nr:hypothetical protein [archaeon]